MQDETTKPRRDDLCAGEPSKRGSLEWPETDAARHWQTAFTGILAYQKGFPERRPVPAMP
jgi:hypothetical protein